MKIMKKRKKELLIRLLKILFQAIKILIKFTFRFIVFAKISFMIYWIMKMKII